MSAIIFVVYFICPLLVAIIFLRRERTLPSIGFIFILCSVACYFLYVAGVELVYWQYKADLDQFDLDGDGTFSENEYTAEAEEAMRRYTSDTGRGFAPFVAAPVSLIWVSLSFALFYLSKIFVAKLRNFNKTEHAG